MVKDWSVREGKVNMDEWPTMTILETRSVRGVESCTDGRAGNVAGRRSRFGLDLDICDRHRASVSD